MRAWGPYGRYGLAFLMFLGTTTIAWKTYQWDQSSALASWAQAAALMATLVYLVNYVASTEQIAKTTQGQLAIAQEPVVAFELNTSSNGLTTNPSMINRSDNHARCFLDLRIVADGRPHPVPAAYNGAGGWIVQARQSAWGSFPTAAIAHDGDTLEQLLEEQRTGRAEPHEQITATVSLRHQRLDGEGRTLELGPLRFYFSATEMGWLPDFPWPR